MKKKAKSKKPVSRKRKAPPVKRVLTLSKYNFGMHHFNDAERGEPSFAESLSPLSFMIDELYKNGAKLGSKIEIVMKVKKGPQVKTSAN